MAVGHQSITINGMPSQNKDVRVDGINIVDEGGCGTAFVNLNMDAIGEVQVIANGYTAENGRNNGGLINVVTKSGTSTLEGLGLVQRPPRPVQRERLLPRSRAARPKPLYRVNISGYSVGGPVVIPGWSTAAAAGGSKKLYFFVSQEYTDDARPTDDQPRQHADRARDAGDFSQTRITNGTIQPIIDPLTGQPFPGNIIPAESHQPARSEDARPAAAAQRRPEPARRARSGRRIQRST